MLLIPTPPSTKIDADVNVSLHNGGISNPQGSCRGAQETQRQRTEAFVESLSLELGLRVPVSVEKARVKADLTIEAFDKDFYGTAATANPGAA